MSFTKFRNDITKFSRREGFVGSSINWSSYHMWAGLFWRSFTHCLKVISIWYNIIVKFTVKFYSLRYIWMQLKIQVDKLTRVLRMENQNSDVTIFLFLNLFYCNLSGTTAKQLTRWQTQDSEKLDLLKCNNLERWNYGVITKHNKRSRTLIVEDDHKTRRGLCIVKLIYSQ